MLRIILLAALACPLPARAAFKAAPLIKPAVGQAQLGARYGGIPAFQPLTLPVLQASPIRTPALTLSSPEKGTGQGEPVYLKLENAARPEVPGEVAFDNAAKKEPAPEPVAAAEATKKAPAPLRRPSAVKKSAKIAAAASAVATPIALASPGLAAQADLPFVLGFFLGFFVPVFIASLGVIFVFRGFARR